MLIQLTLADTLPEMLLDGLPLEEMGFTLSRPQPEGRYVAEPWLYILDPERSAEDGAAFIEQCRLRGRFIEFIVVSRERSFDMLRSFLRLGVLDCVVYPGDAGQWRTALEGAKQVLMGRWISWNSMESRADMDGLLSHIMSSHMDKWDRAAFEEKLSSGSLRKIPGTEFAVLSVWLKFSNTGLAYNDYARISGEAERFVTRFYEMRSLNVLTMNQQGMLVVTLRLPGGQEPVQDAEELLFQMHCREVFQNIDIVIGVSETRKNTDGIFRQLRQAAAAVHAHSDLGKNRVIAYSELRFDTPSPEEVFTPEYRSRLAAIVELTDSRALDGEIDRLDREVLAVSTRERTPLYYLHNGFFDIFLTAAKKLLPPEEYGYIQDQYKRDQQDCDTPQELNAALKKWTVDQLRLAEPENEPAGPAIQKAKKFVLENYSGHITREDAAREAGLNANYFSTCFREYTGLRFTDYVRQVRMEQAKRLLSETTESIAAIAERVGYSEYRHFCKSFSQYAGVTPSSFRKKARTFQHGT